MKLLASQTSVIAISIRNALIKKAKMHIPASKKTAVTKFLKEYAKAEAEYNRVNIERERLNATHSQLSKQMENARRDFIEQLKITAYCNDYALFQSEIKLLDKIAEANVPALTAIEAEVILNATFSKNEDLTSFTQRVVASLDGKK